MSTKPLLKFKSVSCMEDTKGDVMTECIEFNTIDAALQFVELEEQHLKQEYIPGSMGIELHPIDYHTRLTLNEHWLKLMYTNKLYRNRDDA